MAWFRFLKTQSSTSFTYPLTKRVIDQFTPTDTMETGNWIAVDVSGLKINTYIDQNLIEQVDDTSYIVIYEDAVGDTISNSIPCTTIIDNGVLYFQNPVDHIKDSKIDRVYSLYYNSPNLRYITPYQDDFVVDENSKPYAVDISQVDKTSFEVTLQSTSYHNYSFINQESDWSSGTSSKIGARAYLTFTGPNLDLYGNVGPDCGRARVRITSYANTATPYTTIPVDWTVVDFYNREASDNVIVYSVSNIPASEASLELEIISQNNTLSSGNNVQLTSYQFSPSVGIEIGDEQLYGAAPYATVSQYGSAQFFGGSSAFGETVGPTGPTGPQGDEGRLITADSAPLNPLDGEQWLDTSTGRQYAAYNGVWFEVGAAFQGPTGPSGVGFKNYIMNGCMRIWQRGAGPWTTNNTYASDRWQIQAFGTTFSVSQQSFTPGELAGADSPFYLRSVVTAGVGTSDFMLIAQRIEDVRTLAGQTIVFSFWAKASSNGLKIGAEFLQNFGTGGSGSVAGIGSQQITLTTGWQRYSASVTIPSISGKTVGTDSRLTFLMWLDSGVDNIARSSITHQSGTFDIWGVQIETGTVASGFDCRPYQTELALCQRYYYRTTSTGGYSAFCMGWTWNTTTAIGMVQFPVTMRKVPTSVETTGTAADYAVWGPAAAVIPCSAAPVISLANIAGCMVSFSVASGFTAGHATGMYSNNNSVAYLGFSAEY